MNNTKVRRQYFAIILFCSLFGLLIGTVIKNIYYLTAKQPCVWYTKPIVVNCIGEEIKEETITRAINYWNSKGEEVLFYQYNGSEIICSKKGKWEGFIVIREDNGIIDERDVLAATKRYHKNTVEIVSAEIYFKEGTHNFILLLEHELGHAFGYNHKKIPGHIMHPYYDLMGDKFWFPG
jgi:hypothetical protein